MMQIISFLLLSSMSRQTWQLPVIFNDSLKQKLQSISQHQPNYYSGIRSLKSLRKKSKDLYSCLHKVPSRNIFQQSIPVSRQINALSSIINTMAPLKKGKKSARKRYKSKFYSAPIPISRPQGATVSAFIELQRYLINYFNDHQEPHLMQETIQLKTLTRKGASLLRNTLEEFKHRDKVFLDPFINLLFHEISSEVTIVQNAADTIYHLARVEYYALKCNLLQFSAYCLTEQAGIYRETAQMDLAFACLRKGLIIAVKAGNQETIHEMLQKMGIFYYYSGNTALGGYYHRLAERGLTNSETEVYKSQLNIERYIKLLEMKLFNVKKYSLSQSQKEELTSSEETHQIEMQEMQRQELEQKTMVSVMLKDGGLRKIGQRLKNHMRNTSSLASIIPHNHSPSPNQKSKQSLPRINVSHVLKSHLSKNRMPGPGARDWHLFRLMELVDLLPQ